MAHIENKKFWTAKSTLLLAVSGGVDSMVLLELLMKMPPEKRPKIVVGHFNHQLREVSEQEEKGLREYCLMKNIPFFSERWFDIEKNGLTNMEENARNARYAFLFKIMKTQGCDSLITAHHGDDQVETIFMKMLRGSLLSNFVGIQAVSKREGYQIIRPLLPFSKSDIELYAKQQHIMYWQDETNHSEKHLRNRIRKNILPKVKSENPNYIQTFSYFTNQIRAHNELVEEYIRPKLEKMLGDEGQLLLEPFLKESDATKSYLLQLFFQSELIAKGGKLSNQQLVQVMIGLSGEGNKEYYLGNNWYAQKTYGKLIVYHGLENRQIISGIMEEEVSLNEFVLINRESAICLTERHTPPPKQKGWKEHDCLLVSGVELPLKVRGFAQGDRFILNEKGETKKIARYFIDQKIPKENRKMIPLLVNVRGQVLWILGFRKSYLSIDCETDKIFYKITYYKSCESEGETNVRRRYKKNISK